MALGLDIEARYDTFWPPNIDAEVAEDLVGKSSRPLDWTKNRFDPEQVPQGGVDFEASAAYWFQLFEGDGWPSNVGRAGPKSGDGAASSPFLRWNMSDHPGTIHRWNFSGWGGEIVRHHSYKPDDVAAPKKRIAAFMAYRRRIPPLLSQVARDVSADMLENVMAEGKAVGLSGLHLLDWIYVRSQQRRRVPVAFSLGAIFPLLTSQMFLAGFRRSPLEKISAEIVTDMTARLVPEWREVPYFDDLAAQLPLGETNKTLSRRLYWEADRESYSAAKKTGLAAMERHFQEDAFETFAAADRANSNAAQIQNISNRLLWRIGFADFVRRIEDTYRAFAAASGPLPDPITVDSKFSAGRG